MFDEYYYKELREDIRRAIALAEKQNSQNTSVLGGNSLMPQQIAQPSLSTKYAQNGNITNDALSDELLSQNQYNLLGYKESGGDYSRILRENNQDVAFGKYQFRKPALQDLGYMNAQGEWQGKNQIYSTEDFKEKQEVQEQMIKDYMALLNRYNISYRNYDKIGQQLQGINGNFNITKSGILAAAHRRGAKEVAKYLNSLEKNRDNRYYLPYSNFSAERQAELKQIETRLREFEK